MSDERIARVQAAATELAAARLSSRLRSASAFNSNGRLAWVNQKTTVASFEQVVVPASQTL